MPRHKTSKRKTSHPLPDEDLPDNLPQLPVEAQGFGFDETANAKRLIARHGHNMLRCESLGQWYVWDGKRWAVDDTGEVHRNARQTAIAILQEVEYQQTDEARGAAAKWYSASLSARRRREMVDLARYEESVAVRPSDFDRDPWLFNCANGTLDLRTGELGKHRRSDRITCLSPVVHDPDADNSLWKTFLDRATGGDQDLQTFLQRLAGLCLTGITTEEIVVLLYGPSASGKTTFIEALRSVVGDYTRASTFEAFAQHRPDSKRATPEISRLIGARLVTAVETVKSIHLSADLIKWVTGGDTIEARGLYADPREFIPAFKLLFASNERPRIPDDDDAIWRRMLEVQFPVSIPKRERDKTVKERLRDPAVGGPTILAWALRGCLDWQREGLNEPEALRVSTEAYRQAMDPLRPWLDERCRIALHEKASREALWSDWQAWGKENNVTSDMTVPQFCERLRKLGCAPKSDGTSRLWWGIGLREDADAQ